MTLEFEYVQLTTCAYRNITIQGGIHMGYNKKVVINGICFAFIAVSESKARIEVTPATTNATPIRFYGKHNIGIIFTDDAKRTLLTEVILLIHSFDYARWCYKATVGQDLATDVPYVKIEAKSYITRDIPEGYDSCLGVTDDVVVSLMENMYFVA